jgi:UDP-N-acetylmuramyl pentapeptide phosphotransferase/UDP-N-acetylglucosamine-1-phosphate transferase
MEYLIIAIILFVSMLFYFKIADKYNIIDKPNHRSAHTEITLRGGGIIFWFVALIYFVQNVGESYFFFSGITIMSLVSFWDDIQSLPNKVRLFAHFLAISLVFYSLNLFQILPIYAIVISYILFIGIINAYNFMDGINGITGLYTIIVLSSLFYVNLRIQNFIDPKFIIYPIIASCVFLFFNFRKRAKCFAGDVGSIAVAFWVVFMILMLVLATNSLVWILFLAVYGIDTVCTITHRLYLKENIFEAHRHHFYQILSNDYKLDHRLVASFYGLAQLVVSVLIIYLYKILPDIIISIVVLAPLIFIYLLKFLFIKNKKK